MEAIVAVATHRRRCSLLPTMKTVFILILSGLLSVTFVVRRWFKGPSSSNSENENQKPKLRFSSSGTFQILQLTDLHYGEEPSTDWGPLQDVMSTLMIRSVLTHEKPDLIVLSGDQITADNIDANATAVLDQISNLLEEFAIPYALVFGNHDDNNYWKTVENGTDIRHAARTSRVTLMNAHARHSHALGQVGPSTANGVSNYVLPVYNYKQQNSTDDTNNREQMKEGDDQDSVQLQIMLLDSGGGSMTEEIVLNQLDWYMQQRQQSSLDNTFIPAVAFQHIPTQEFGNYWKTPADNTNGRAAAVCSGFHGEPQIAPLENDPHGEIQFLQRNDPSLLFLAVGHNHGNSYCCPAVSSSSSNQTNNTNNNNSLHLCFGRHSGYGGYGSWERGARMFELSVSDDYLSTTTTLSGGVVTWKSWVRLHSGDIDNEFQPLQ